MNVCIDCGERQSSNYRLLCQRCGSRRLETELVVEQFPRSIWFGEPPLTPDENDPELDRCRSQSPIAKRRGQTKKDHRIVLGVEGLGYIIFSLAGVMTLRDDEVQLDR